MASCSACEGTIEKENRFTCSYCNLEFCVEHRLPEKHDCAAIDFAETLGPELREGKLREDHRDEEIERERVVAKVGNTADGAAGKPHREWEPDTKSPDVTLVEEDEEPEDNESAKDEGRPWMLWFLTAWVAGAVLLYLFVL